MSGTIIIRCLFNKSMNILLIFRSFIKVLLFITSLIIPPILDITLETMSTKMDKVEKHRFDNCVCAKKKTKYIKYLVI